MTRNTAWASRRIGRTCSGLVLAALLCGCHTRGPDRGARPSTTWVIHIKDFRFQPAQLTVVAGDLVVWLNDDAFRHSAVADARSWGTPELDRGQRGQWMPEAPGEYQYHCSAHPTMRATLTVQERPWR